ncbi:undecaprenyl/decaprenyl-phosphate alpha-N-acetylglucosaminyl 1-phosphate transferase [Candidatus Falkowbacteria bacterium]|nr:undecaprenyl/decaprenyl-phosphate alpha-N-acetylglucosaminyl 1-phosphate transferase [Candidatus Falkowbacteria bacterium]MBT5503226.1 undecaprenyl/decaprenyl-phosphate alpha-N-acetylglucosaminyl 1-phosphate transferase [Candidatus Falkowbacteria bacterium]MBT6574225.1 undecaprenyl/decaprenyl-phosphate alpha-N-acetylglucosaminyl 1-phosphate transferase [Candidatus Falkowbacteria bacterium]MBT7348524.1 undecaprenyl/decaprenyl-phosphate alpha-N-acetylglucosaminyl 1-phosphate transferase [Candid
MNSYDYIFALMLSFFACLILTPVVIWIAKRSKAIDRPDGQRKIHKKPTPLFGGLAIFLSINLVILIYSIITKDLIGDTIILKNLLGIFIGSLFLAVGGILDDKFDLKPKWQIIWPVFAILSVIICGIGIEFISNPIGEGLFELNKYSFNLFWYEGFPYKVTLFADLFTFAWLIAMMYTTKLLDGLDGLVSGIAIIASVFIFLTALNKGDIIQYDVALLAVIIAGVFAGFLVFNFNPANIFLGEGGSTMAGFLLGSLSIISGSKVGITLMLLSIPVLDFIWTLIRRRMENKPLFSADRKHLHHRLLDAGLSVKQAVYFLYLIAILFGLIAYSFQDKGLSFMAAVVLVVVVFMLILAYVYTKKKRRDRLLTGEIK